MNGGEEWKKKKLQVSVKNIYYYFEVISSNKKTKVSLWESDSFANYLSRE